MTDVLYATHGGFGATDTNLYTVDTGSMVATAVGDTSHLFTGLAFDPTNGTMYGVTGNIGADQQTLFTINTTTGAVTSIGALGTTIADITFDSTGQMYGWKVSTKRLATINKASGAVVEVGASGISGSASGNGLAVDPNDDNLVWLFPKGGAGDIYNVNKTTGAATDMGVLTPTVAASSNIGAAAFGPSDVLYGLGNDSPGPLFTVGAPNGFSEYPETLVGNMPSSEPWDGLAWLLDAGGGGGGGGPVVGTLWTVEHYEHEFTAVVVGDPDIEDNGVLLNTVRPENLHFLWQLAEFGPSEIDYEISLSAADEITDLAVVGLDFVRPYFQDWSLYRGTQLLLAGMITSLTIQAGGESVKIGGKDWLHYLERRCWPYDADLSYVNWPSGFRFKVAAAEVGAIVTDILETVRDVSGNFPGPPNDVTFPSYSLKFTVDADSTGTNRNYEIPPFETSSVFDLVRSLSQMDKSDGGFDFYMTPDRPPDTVFKLVYPEIGTPGSPIYTLEVDEATAFANMLELGYTDSGPEASHVLGVGAGTSTRSGGVNKHLRIVSARTRRLDKVGDFGDVKNLATLESKTLADLNRAWRSIHEIPILVDPADITDFWTLTRPGEYVMVNYDLFGHQINSVQKIVSMDVNVDLEGNERVQLGLNQLVEGGSTDVASDP